MERVVPWHAVVMRRRLNALVTRLGDLIFAPSATRHPSVRAGLAFPEKPIHHNNRYAFLRHAMRPCSRASLTAARLYC
jgi:hypothetical protein